MAYKIIDGDHYYYRTEAGESVESFAKKGRTTGLSPEVLKVIEDALKGNAEEVTGVQAIKDMADFISAWGNRVAKTQDARREEVITAINNGGNIKAIQAASGVTWATVISWAKPGSDDKPKPMRVSAKTMDKIEAAQKAAKEEAAAQKAAKEEAAKATLEDAVY